MSDPLDPRPSPDSGLYQLIIRLKRHTTVSPGRLGVFRLPRGLYVYTGSGKRHLRARMARHSGKHKRLWWHVDYLLQYGIIEKGLVYPPDLFTECELSRLALEALKGRIPIPGFGASDCGCRGHLIHCPSVGEAAGVEGAVCVEGGLRTSPLGWEMPFDITYLEFRG